MIKSSIVSLWLLCLSLPTSLFSTDHLEIKQIQILSQTCKAFESPLADCIWPGFKFNHKPAIAYFKNSHIYAFYLDSSPSWKALSHLHPHLQFSEKDRWGITQVPLHPAFPIGKQKAFVFCLEIDKQEDVELPLLILIHERFHLHQFEHFNRHEEGVANYKDEWNEDNQVLMELENWLLVQFLKNKHQPEKRMEYLRDFVAVNQNRYQLLKTSSKAWEDLQQRMEGLADYVSMKTYETFPLLTGFSVEDSLLKAREKKLEGDFSILSDAVKGRHYFIGATLGFALDSCQVQWKSQVERGDSLRSLLARALSLSQDEVRRRVAKLKSSNAYEVIRSKVRQSLAKEKALITQTMQSYESAEGISIELAIPRRPISGGGQTDKRCFLGNGETICLGDTSFSTSQDQRWNLSFKSIPFVFEDMTGVRMFKLAKDTEVYIDRKPIRLHDLQKQILTLPFYSLAWNDRHSEFKSTLPGTLYVEDGDIFIEFE